MKQPELGQKIIALRKKKGLTQDELVQRCNLNVRTLQRIESGEVNPRSYTTRIILEALDYNTNDTSNKQQRAKIYIENKINEIYLQIQNISSMKNSKNFFYNYFLSTGIVWFLCALSIVLFDLNFQIKEILLTLIFPLAFAIFRQFSIGEFSNTSQDKGE